MIIATGRLCHDFYQIRTQRHQLIMTDNSSLKIFFCGFLSMFLLRLLWDFPLSESIFEVVYQVRDVIWLYMVNTYQLLHASEMEQKFRSLLLIKHLFLVSIFVLYK